MKVLRAKSLLLGAILGTALIAPACNRDRGTEPATEERGAPTAGMRGPGVTGTTVPGTPPPARIPPPAPAPGANPQSRSAP